MYTKKLIAVAAACSLTAAACGGGSQDGEDDRSLDSVVSPVDSIPVDTDPVDEPAPEPEPEPVEPVPDVPVEEPVEEVPLEGVADWTVLVYVMGDNDLEPFAVQDLLEMSSVNANERVNVVALADRHPEYTLDDDPLGDFAGTQIFQVSPEGLTPLGDETELNVGSPDTLAGFIETGIGQFPAEQYSVILWNHGAGWPGMGPDETDGNDILDLADINRGFEQGLAAAGVDSIDLVGFDACLMASYEVASVMSEHADLMIASQELEPGHGWNYAALEALAQNPDSTATELGQTIIDGFAAQAEEAGTNEDITLSLVDLTKMDELEAQLRNLAEPLMADPAVSAPTLGRAQADALKFGANPDPSIDSYHVDLGNVATSLGSRDPFLSETARSVVAAIDDMVVSTTSGPATTSATGLSIYFPPYADVFRQGYLNLEGVEVWPDLLTSFFTAGQAIPEAEQPAFLPTEGRVDGEGEYFFDEDGLNLFGTFDLAAEGNIVEAEIIYGVLDETDGSTIFIGEEPAEVSDDGSGLAGAIYDLTVLTISDGEDTDFAYLDLNIDRESEIVTIDVPLWYVPPEEFETDDLPHDVVLSLVLDLDFNILSEVYYSINPDGTVGELNADPNGLIYPVVLNEYPDGTLEWLTLSERGLFASLPELQYNVEPLDPGTGLYAELVIRDFGGNTASVSMFDLVPG